MKAIVKVPGQFGLVRECTEEDIAAVLFGAVGRIDVLDTVYLFNAKFNAPEVREGMSPAFGRGFDTIVTYEGARMRINELRGVVLIVGKGKDGELTDAPARLLRIAEDIF